MSTLSIPYLSNETSQVQSAPKKYYVSWQRNDELIKELAQNILKSNWEPDTIICIARGGMMAGLRLSHLLDKKLGIIVAQSYGGDQQGQLKIAPQIAILADSIGKNILLVDDLVDSGITLREIKNHLLERFKEIDEIRTAVLWEKTCSKFSPDYYVENVDKSIWIVQPFEKD